MTKSNLAFPALLLAASLVCAHSASADLELNNNDHIAFIGNALPDRMQHDAWLETYLQAANPDKQLVIRNLGLTGDRVASRPRNQNFMNPDDSLTLVEADVIFAFFVFFVGVCIEAVKGEP